MCALGKVIERVVPDVAPRLRPADYSAAIGYDCCIVSIATSAPTVGLSWNVVGSTGDAERPDGIGVYTRELERAVIDEDVVVRRVTTSRSARAKFGNTV